MLIGIVFVATVLIIALFFAWFFRQQAINKERLILIEKGENLDELFDKKEKRSSFPWLKLGILITGLSIGFLGQGFLVNKNVTGNEPLYLFVLGFCGGVSMIIAHYVDKRQKKE